MRSTALAVVFVSTVVVLAADPSPRADGWVDLLDRADTTIWQKIDPNWVFAESVALGTDKATRLAPSGQGNVWVNGPKGRTADLITRQTYQDVEVHVEFLLGKNSNSGIKFHALYEIQLRDTATKSATLTGDDCGGIYPRADDTKGYKHLDKGIAPKVNAAKPAGEWQTLDVTFRSPRINGQGEKTANAVVVKATLNGQLVHENVELKTPTGANWVKKEMAAGPFMLQADHGPVAFRNVRLRVVK